MKILMYARMEEGGIKTHVNELTKFLSKRHDITLISEKDIGMIKVLDGYYWIDKPKAIDIIRKHLSDCDILHVHEPATSSEFLLNSIKEDFNMVNTFHAAVGPNIYGKIGAEVARFFAMVHSQKSKYYIAVGRMLEEIIKGYNKTIVINNGVDTERFKPVKAERYFDEFTVGYLGRFAPEKNVIELIKACSKLNVNLVVAGTGMIYNHIKRYENKNLKVLGHLSNPVKFYNSIDVFASPSFIEANICRTTLEAMSCGKPVIVSSCGGEESQIKKSFGRVCSTDATSIKKAILEMKKSDYVKAGKIARKTAVEKFEVRKMAAKTEEVYKKIYYDN